MCSSSRLAPAEYPRLEVKRAKAQWRRRLRAALAAVPPAARQAAEAQIVEHLLALVGELGALAGRAVAAYAAYGREVDVTPFARALHARGVHVAWPRVVGPGALAFAVVTDPERLAAGFRGIPEPPRDAPVVALEDLDLIVVPGLGFDLHGRRLGQGGGYYDRLLADPRRRAVTVGVGLAAQLIARVPVQDHDVALDAVVTELGVARGGRWSPLAAGWRATR